jgi:hypothetical protein
VHGFASFQVLLEVAQPGGRANFVEPLVNFETREPTLKTQFMEQGR